MSCMLNYRYKCKGGSMTFLVSVLGVIYYLIFCPLIMGLMITKVRNKMDNNVIVTIIYGYITMFTLFYITAVPTILVGSTLVHLAQTWMIVCTGTVVIEILIHFKQIPIYLSNNIQMWKNVDKALLLLEIVVFAVAFIAALFLIPVYGSQVIPLANIAKETNTIFAINPYSGIGYAEVPSEMIYSPFAMFYACISSLTQIEVAMIVKLIIPIIYIPLYFGGYYAIAIRVFCGDKMKSITLIYALIGIYIFLAFTNQSASINMLRNSWQPETILMNGILPGVFYVGFNIYENMKIKISDIVLLGMLLVNAKLLEKNGIVLVMIMIIIISGCVLERSIWKKCHQL